MLGRLVAVSSLVAFVLLVLLLQTTQPATIGPLGILAVFILMYMSALGVLTFLIYWVNRLMIRMTVSLTIKRPLEPMSFGRSYYYASVAALAPVMIIGMQSVGDVGFYDLLLVVVFEVIACVYIAKRGN